MPIFAKDERWQLYVPSGVTVARIILTPLFLDLLLANRLLAATGLFVLLGFSDMLDGYLARRLNAETSFGAYLDVAADFLLVFSAFFAFVIKGVYPYWLLLLISAMFLQFVLSSSSKPTFDPLGKYYGAFLFIAIGLTLMLPDLALTYALLLIILAVTLVSLTSRWLYFLRQRRNLN